jgi:hypothetical protein
VIACHFSIMKKEDTGKATGGEGLKEENKKIIMQI